MLLIGYEGSKVRNNKLLVSVTLEFVGRIFLNCAYDPNWYDEYAKFKKS